LEARIGSADALRPFIQLIRDGGVDSSDRSRTATLAKSYGNSSAHATPTSPTDRYERRSVGPPAGIFHRNARLTRGITAAPEFQAMRKLLKRLELAISLKEGTLFH
jgi:hypothetical protein